MAGKKILIIDDDILLCKALIRKFTLMGMNALFVSKGAESLKIVKEQAFDLIFVDVHLPDFNGLDLLEEMKAITPLSKFVVITADPDEDYRITSINRGASGFIEKPFGFFDVKNLMDEIFPDQVEKRGYQRYTCCIPCNISFIEEFHGGGGVDKKNSHFKATVVDFGKYGIKLRLKKDIKEIAEGKCISLLTAVQDHSFFDFFPSNITAEVVWVKKTDREIFTGLKYLSTTDLNTAIEA